MLKTIVLSTIICGLAFALQKQPETQNGHVHHHIRNSTKLSVVEHAAETAKISGTDTSPIPSDQGCNEEKTIVDTVQAVLLKSLSVGWYGTITSSTSTKTKRRRVRSQRFPIPSKQIFDKMKWHLRMEPVKKANEWFPNQDMESVDLSGLNVPFKEVCNVLQGYLSIAKSRSYDAKKGTDFTIMFGGEKHTVGIGLARWAKHQLIIKFPGKKPTSYKDIFKVFDKYPDDQNKISAFIWKNFNGEQVTSEKVFPNIIGTEKAELLSKMLDFTMIANIAEAAPPMQDQLKFLIDHNTVVYPTEEFKILRKGSKANNDILFPTGRNIGADMVWQYIMETLRDAHERGDQEMISKAFSPENFPYQSKQGTNKGRQWAKRGMELEDEAKAKEDGRSTGQKVKYDLGCQKKKGSKRRTLCSIMDELVLDEQSIHVEESSIHYEFYDPYDHDIRYKRSTPIDTEHLYITHKINDKQSATTFMDRFRKIYAGYGMAMSVLGAVGAFEEGDIGQGSLLAAQSVHSIGSLVGINGRISKITTRALSQVLEKGADKLGLKLGEMFAAKLEGFMARVSPVGLAFDIIFITEDVNELKEALNSKDVDKEILAGIHLGLDATIALLSSLGPETEPAVIVLSLYRMTIDTFYIDISNEMKKAHGPLNKMFAFFKGYAEAVEHIYEDIFTFGLASKVRYLDDRQRQDQAFINELAKPESYYKLKGHNCDGLGTMIDFTDGIYSGLGGEIRFKLGDDGYFTVELSEVPADGGGTKTISKRFYCPGLTDVVLGIGEAKKLTWRKEEAKFLFSVVKTVKVIDQLEDNNQTTYGSYEGNSLNNTFYAIQGNFTHVSENECEDPKHTDEITIRLRNYHYLLNGKAGNDLFLLGPQRNNVTGGDGHDLYKFIPHGGNTIIDNFALDQLSDTLFLNVTYDHVSCSRTMYDLLITYCHTHFIKVRKWFYPVRHEFHRHLIIQTRDGIRLKVVDKGISHLNRNYQVSCMPHTIDRSYETKGQVLNLTETSFQKVTCVVGSQGNDVVVGNDLDNYITSGPGNNHISGGKGADTYIITSGSGCNYVDNYADDGKSDTLMLPMNYNDVKLEKIVPSDTTSHNINVTDLKVSNGDMNAGVENVCIYARNWFSGKHYQHLLFITQDSILFEVKEVDGTLKKQPSILDFTKSTHGININLKLNTTFRTVVTIIDSKHPDNIVGSDAQNFFSSQGRDRLRGNGGNDVYRLKKDCRDTIIDNYATDDAQDVIYTDETFTSLRVQVVDGDSLILEVSSTTVVQLVHWFRNGSYRHLLVRTSDGVTARLPNSTSEMYTWSNRLQRVEISRAYEDCDFKLKTYNLTKHGFSQVTRFTAKSDRCSYRVIGNEENNYIDPGPGNPYGSQYLQGGNGSDVYVIGYGYGEFNVINNYAQDTQFDMVIMDIGYTFISVSKEGDDLFLTSTSPHDEVSLRLIKYLYAPEYQHVVFKSSDKVLFVLEEQYPYVKVLSVDYRDSAHSHIMNMNTHFRRASIYYGPTWKTNVIYGSEYSKKLSGGLLNDNIQGGALGEEIYGFAGNDTIVGNDGDDVIDGGDGNDVIFGNSGDDAIFGGSGSDVIYGGEGSDAIVFVGDGVEGSGVVVSLTNGFGRGADAEGDVYTSIESVIGSEFDDIIEGNNCDNVLSGKAGNDSIVSHGGFDFLSGGLGSDIYDLTNASGWKIVDNYATDISLDTMRFGKMSCEPCFYSFQNDTLIHFPMEKEKSINVMFQGWHNGNDEYQHLMLEYTTSNNIPKKQILTFDTSLDEEPAAHELAKDFRNESEIKLVSYDSHSITLDFTIGARARISTRLYQIKLNYVSEGGKNKTIVTNGNSGRTSVTDVLAGVVTSIALSLHRCSHVLAISSLLIQRTRPNAPKKLRVSHISSVSMTLEWTSPPLSTDPNSPYYSYRCTATPQLQPNRTIQVSTSENRTQCSFHRLRPKTEYIIHVFSVAGSEESVLALTHRQVTGALCRGIQEPRHGVITAEKIVEGKEWAQVVCNTGFRLALIDFNGSVVRNMTSSSHLVPCDTRLRIKCLRIPCSIKSLSQNNLRIIRIIQSTDDENRTPFREHKVMVRCVPNLQFINDWKLSSKTITCVNGEWVPLPQCRFYAYCPLPFFEYGDYSFDYDIYLLWPRDLPNGVTVRFYCNRGYRLLGNDLATCQDGEFIPPSPKCQVLHCPVISNPTNGYAISDNYPPRHGSIYTFSCRKGYRLKGPPSTTCNDGSWIAKDLPICQERREYNIIGKTPRPIQTEKELSTLKKIGKEFNIRFQFKLMELPVGNATIFSTTTSAKKEHEGASMIPSIQVMGNKLVVIYESKDNVIPQIFRTYSLQTRTWYRVVIKQTCKKLLVKIKEVNGEKGQEVLFAVKHIPDTVYKNLQVMPRSKAHANGVMKKLYIKGSC